MQYTSTLLLKFSVRYVYPYYLFYCFKRVRRVCPNLSSAPCRLTLVRSKTQFCDPNLARSASFCQIWIRIQDLMMRIQDLMMRNQMHPRYRIHRSKKHRIPDPDLQHCVKLGVDFGGIQMVSRGSGSASTWCWSTPQLKLVIEKNVKERIPVHAVWTLPIMKEKPSITMLSVAWIPAVLHTVMWMQIHSVVNVTHPDLVGSSVPEWDVYPATRIWIFVPSLMPIQQNKEEGKQFIKTSSLT